MHIFGYTTVLLAAVAALASPTEGASKIGAPYYFWRFAEWSEHGPELELQYDIVDRGDQDGLPDAFTRRIDQARVLVGQATAASPRARRRASRALAARLREAGRLINRAERGRGRAPVSPACGAAIRDLLEEIRTLVATARRHALESRSK